MTKAGGLGLMVAALSLSACTLGPRWSGPVSQHFDGQRFIPAERFDKGLLDLVRYYREKPPSEWAWEDRPVGPPPLRRVPVGSLRVTYVNHATVLLQVDGLNVLTDPVWSPRIGPLPALGAPRYRPAGLRFEELPPIDLVLISHNHYDHLDLPTLQRLNRHSQPVFIVPPGDASWLRDAGLGDVRELSWGRRQMLQNECALWAVATRHWSQRRTDDRNRSHWLAFVLETSLGPVYFAGDTGYGPHFREVRARFGPMRLALLPIGAYRPRWLTSYQHMDPGEAVQAHIDLRAAQSLGIHWGTFELSAEGPMEPVNDLAASRLERRVPTADFYAPEHGVAQDFVGPVARGQHCQPRVGGQALD